MQSTGPGHENHAAPPDANGHRQIYLLDAATPLETQLLNEWIAQQPTGGHPPEAIPIPPSRGRRKAAIDGRLEVALASDDDPLLMPLRVAWQPPQRDGVHEARLSDLLTLGDPRDPGALRQRWIYNRHPERCTVVVGKPARLSELRERWRRAAGSHADQMVSLTEFVARQAALALERAERRLRGARYKVPRFVHEEILSRPAFRAGLARLARELGRDEGRVTKDAGRYLHEIAATHSTYVIDLVANLVRILYQQGYGAVNYDRAELERVYALAQRHPVVFLPSHKSNLDHLVLQYALHVNSLPPNHTAGGINMNFLPVGPLVRRTGVFFIRRSFKDNATYKFVLRQYIDYLVEKRFPLEFYIEGGRSRSGKLLPPHFGLLAYVVDSYRRGKSEDVHLLPVSIAYDQIQDVGDYVAEQRGGAKQRENFGWFVRTVRKLRRRYGNIHIRFGAPVSLAEALGPPDPAAEPNPDEKNLALQKLAFEVCLRVNRVTPITPTSLVAFALLSMADRALTLGETHALVQDLVTAVRRRHLPTTTALDLDQPADVEAALAALVENGVVTRFAEGSENIYLIAPDQQLTAAYYRNTIIHFFLNGAITELALVHAKDMLTTPDASPPSPDTRRPPPYDAFWNETYRLRDLFKFEFFFADKDTYRDEIDTELCLYAPEWKAELETDPQAPANLLRRIRPYSAYSVLRPFADAYRVVADALTRLPAGQSVEDGPFIKRCLALGKQYHLQRRIRSAESVSKVLLETALKLARNRGLLDQSAADVAARRLAFADELRQVLRRMDTIEALAAARFTGLVE